MDSYIDTLTEQVKDKIDSIKGNKSFQMLEYFKPGVGIDVGITFAVTDIK